MLYLWIYIFQLKMKINSKSERCFVKILFIFLNQKKRTIIWKISFNVLAFYQKNLTIIKHFLNQAWIYRIIRIFLHWTGRCSVLCKISFPIVLWVIRSSRILYVLIKSWNIALFWNNYIFIQRWLLMTQKMRHEWQNPKIFYWNKP